MAKNSATFDGTTEIHRTAEGTAIILTGGVLGSKQIRTTPRTGSKTDDATKAALEQIQVREVLRELRWNLPTGAVLRKIVGHLNGNIADEGSYITVVTWVTEGEEIIFAIRREADTLWIDLDLSKHIQGQHSDDSVQMHEVSPGQFVPLDLMRSWCDGAVDVTELLRSKIGAWADLQIIVAAAEQPEEDLEEEYEFSFKAPNKMHYSGTITFSEDTQTAEFACSFSVAGQYAGDLKAFIVVASSTSVVLVRMISGVAIEITRTHMRMIIEGWLRDGGINLPLQFIGNS